jgi:hypothetical protein
MLSVGVKQLGCGTDNCVLCGAKLRDEGRYTDTSPYVFVVLTGAVLLLPLLF